MDTKEVLLNESKCFIIEGPKDNGYNQIRVINDTQKENFHVRLRVVRKGTSGIEEYGVYSLKNKGDADTVTNFIDTGSKVEVTVGKDFDGDSAFTVSYKNYPLFQIVVVHIIESNLFD